MLKKEKKSKEYKAFTVQFTFTAELVFKEDPSFFSLKTNKKKLIQAEIS